MDEFEKRDSQEETQQEEELQAQEQQVEFSLKGSEKHTKAHCARVLLYAILIAKKMNLYPELGDASGAATVLPDTRPQQDETVAGDG